MGRLPPIPVSPALAELLEKTGELDRILDGRGLTFDNPRPPKLKPPALFIIEPADWDEEERERQARERQAREADFQAELTRRQAHDPQRGLDPEQLEEEPAEHPAPPKRRPWQRSSP